MNSIAENAIREAARSDLAVEKLRLHTKMSQSEAREKAMAIASVSTRSLAESAEWLLHREVRGDS